ncbi:UDP-2,3-diacylglucosamine hydrolase [Oxalobacteraceae bacterium GrIS 1.18]
MSIRNQTARPKPVALFISDLHLQADMPRTTDAFLYFLKHQALEAQQLYLLGDIFEYWAGDDDLASAYPQRIAKALRAVSDAGVTMFWTAGNRDFLVGQQFALAIGATILPDPFVLTYAGQRYILAHGDQLCTDDIAYQRFRAQVREPEWQAAFLARPLEERKNMIAAMRVQSQLHQQQSVMISDVNQDAVNRLFEDQQANILIHGHTHRPAKHCIGGTVRHVLSDWDKDHGAVRGDYLALLSDGSLQRYDCLGNAVELNEKHSQ